MKFLNKFRVFFSVSILAFFAVSCEEDIPGNPILGENYVSFEPNKTVYIATDDAVTVDVKVYASQAKSFDRIIDLVVDLDGTSTDVGTDGDYGSTLPIDNYSVPSSVTIPAGATEAVFTVTGVTPAGSDKTIIIGFVQDEDLDIHFSSTYTSVTTLDGVDYTSHYREITLTVTEICGDNPFRIEISTDAYGSEATWELYDSNFNLIASGGPYSDVGDGSGGPSQDGPFAQIPVNLCLPSGNYTFYAYDSYGDGWNTDYDDDGVVDYSGSYRLIKMSPFGEVIEVIHSFSSPNNWSIDEFSFSLP